MLKFATRTPPCLVSEARNSLRPRAGYATETLMEKEETNTRILQDDYAQKTKQPWCCSYGGMCARGKTSDEAFRKLQETFGEITKPIHTRERIEFA